MPSADGGGSWVELLLVVGTGGSRVDGCGGARPSAAGTGAVALARASLGGKMIEGRSLSVVAFLLVFLGPCRDVLSALMAGMEAEWPRRLLLVVAVGMVGSEMEGEGVRRGENRQRDSGQPFAKVRAASTSYTLPSSPPTPPQSLYARTCCASR